MACVCAAVCILLAPACYDAIDSGSPDTGRADAAIDGGGGGEDAGLTDAAVKDAGHPQGDGGRDAGAEDDAGAGGDAAVGDGGGVEIDAGADGGPDGGFDAGPDVNPLANFQLTAQSYFSLSRELIAIPTAVGADNGVLASWRSVPGDVDGISFDVRRSDLFLDGHCALYPHVGDTSAGSYFDVVDISGKEYFYCVQPSGPAGLSYPASNISKVIGAGAGAIEFAVTGCGQVKDAGLKFVKKVQPGDLNGDGRIDFVAAYCDVDGDSTAEMNLSCSETGSSYLEAFVRNADGSWSTAWCKSFVGATLYDLLVWDFNGDGNAEVSVTSSPTELSLYDGASGGLLSAIPWPWLDPNRYDIMDAVVAYLDGADPSIVIKTKGCRSDTDIG